MNIALCPVLPQFMRGIARHHGASPVQDSLPQGWTRYHHPEGDYSYYHNPHLGLYTTQNPSDSLACQLLHDSRDLIHTTLTEVIDASNVELVIDFTDAMRNAQTVWYYAVHRTLKQVGWLDFTAGTFGIHPDYFQSSLQPEYWKHVELYPGGISMDDHAYNDLHGRLLAAQLPFLNQRLVPWSREQCRQHLSALEYEIDARPIDHRMAEIGKLMFIIHTYLHSRLYSWHNNAPRHVASPAIYTDQPAQQFLVTPPPTGLEGFRLAAFDFAVISSAIYLMMLVRTGRYLGLGKSYLFAGLFTAVTAGLLPAFAPNLYRHVEALLVFGRNLRSSFCNYVFATLLIIDVLVYCLLLGPLSRSMAEPDFTAAIHDVDQTILLATLFAPPLVFVMRLNHILIMERDGDIEHEVEND